MRADAICLDGVQPTIIVNKSYESGKEEEVGQN